MKRLLLLAFSLLLIAYGSVIVNERLAVARLKNVSPVVSKTLPAVVFSAGDSSFVFRPYDNETAGKLVELLPKTLVMTRWGDGAYSASLSGKADVSGNETSHRRAFFKGEVVFSPKRNALFLMFDATPVALTVDAPMLLSSGGIPVGRLENYQELEPLPGVVEFSVKIKK